MEFPVEHITERYASDYDLSLDVARAHERECKRFLILCALNHGESYGMRGPTDNYWHTFIMFTKEYQAFCDQVAGRFLHHVPRSSKSPPKGKSSGGYRRMLEDYKKVFGEDPPPELWPRVGRKSSAALELCSFNLCSCDSCIIEPEPPDSCIEPVPDDGDDD